MANLKADTLVYPKQARPCRRAGLEWSHVDTLEAALTDLTANFATDFAEGRIGQRSETIAHRSRVLRQMAAELADMRRRTVA